MVDKTKGFLDSQLEVLPDPCNDRRCPEALPLCHKPLTDENLWTSADTPNWKLLREHLRREGAMTKE